MKKALAIISILFLTFSSISAQKKLLSQINSLDTKETVNLKYNNKGQLVYFEEKGIVTFREFSFKYDKNSNKLSECNMNQDRGELVTNSKYHYNDGYITEEIVSSGKQVREKKVIDHIKIHIDNKNRLTKTVFDDGKPWEEFVYDENNNMIIYTQHSALTEGGSKIIKYKFNQDKSAFWAIEHIPAWFWAWHINSMRWCRDFIGQNNPNEFTTEDPKYGTDTIEVTYEYDHDGFPTKQYYNGKLVREFI
ncbi:hypothetical protein JGH11_17265, partial [Dysgonomonas sp. Marseille-P4677]|uniref:hypothetical protein n=1 Tax=Dysgonomonas sp. Marseille-P4677 TaxID=2364790 RepID=UPI0019122D08